ncbi:3'-5' exonuclease [Zavarzinella formosa]|uniref:3'-5' exonuclease n=1 Tax=Zavarzinella formosa TaxID=360055 RepID=UPI0002DF4897|nr:3'-5' exonuclease [Zavarzinella formosa]
MNSLNLFEDPPTPHIAPGRFAAIDFETADHGADSACSVGIIVVDGLKVTRKAHFLIRPPRKNMRFTYVHGITWKDVEKEPVFAEVWPKAAELLEGVEFLAAHNASFDRGVLEACCRVSGLPLPPVPFQCTVRIARKAWQLRSNRLPDVARHLGIPLNHHHAESDALACAGIVIAARMQGHLAGNFVR